MYKAAIPVLMALVVFQGACGSGSNRLQNTRSNDARESPTIPEPLNLNFASGRFISRTGDEMQVAVGPSEVVVTVDLSAAAVFDCRTNCLEDIRAQLSGVTEATAICLFGTTEGSKNRVFKLWVERNAPPCPVSTETIRNE